MTRGDIFRPARYGASLRERPRWLGAFAALSLVSVAIGLLSGPAGASLTAANLPGGAGAGDRAAVSGMLDDAAAVDALFLPVRLFCGWVTFALGLTYACRVWKGPSVVRFRPVFAAAVYAEAALVAGNAAAAVSAAAAGTPGVPWVPGGLDALAATGDFVARYLLNAVNPFSAAHLAILTVTLAAATGLPRLKAGVSAVASWAAAVALNAAIIHALLDEFHFPL